MAKFLDLTGLKYFWAEVKERIEGKISTSQIGVAGGVAELDSTGKVPTAQLPSYVDDVLEYDAKANFPTTGETGKIYVDTATNKTYRWSGTTYVEISSSLALGETSSTAYRGDYGKIAYQHSQAAHAPTTAATENAMGLMSAEDKAKLDGIEEGANNYTLTKDKIVSALGYTPGTSSTEPITYELTKSGTTITLTGSDGTSTSVTDADTNTTYSAATTSAAGLMSAADKSKLDAITASADSVSFSQDLTEGTKVGTITINGTATTLYAPTNTDTTYDALTNSEIDTVFA